MIDLNEIQTIEHDVLVVGAGGAGLRAAIETSNLGLNTGVITKSLLGKAHTVMAEGGMAAAMGNVDSRDNWKVHFRDTMRGGKFLNVWEMAAVHAQDAPGRVRELEDWGAVFDRTRTGLINQRNFGGHRYPRLAHVGDRTGLELIRTLQDHGIHQGMDVHSECIGVDLLKDGGKISGMLAYWRDTGRFVVFRAPVVIFATGGAGKAWRVTSNSWEYTGDGYGMATRAGAELMDMEFTQFHPTGMVWPPSVRGILVTEGVRGEGGILTNSDGVRFMFDNIPERFAPETADTKEEGQRWLDGDREARRPPELLTRDVVARAIMREVKSGRGSEHGGAYLDISHRDSDFVKRKLPSMYHQFKELAEVDITAQPMEVGPTLHYYMGGIRVNAHSQMTNVPGLFAAGECSAGLHGANRLGGNSLSDLIVFGARAGIGAKEYLDNLSGSPTVQQEQVHQHMRGVTDFLNREDGENPYVVVDDLQKIMELNVGIVREGEELEKGIEELQKLKERVKKVKAHPTSQYNPGWNTCIDLRNMITSAEATALCALQREESRGAHTRLDFEGEREEGLTYNGVVHLTESGELKVRKEMRKDAPEDLQKIAHSTLEELEGNRV